VTLLALLGFYVAEAAILDLGPHPWWVDLQLTVKWNLYDSWGIVSGLLYGASARSGQSVVRLSWEQRLALRSSPSR
jgi:hypothetical protein